MQGGAPTVSRRCSGCGKSRMFVAGAAAAVTPGGLTAGPDFFRLLFPAMLAVLIIFRVGILVSKDTIKRPFGVLLLGTYLVVTAMSYLLQ